MSVASFDELSHKIKETLITNVEIVQGLTFTAEEMLAMTLKYLASGCTYTELHYNFRVGITTASIIVPRMCNLLWITLKQECFPVPTEQRWRNIAKGFEKRANFPHCIGAIDGKHVRMIKPAHSGSLYYNYKNFFSVVLLAVSDSNYCFTYIDVGSYGKDSDGAIFKNCSLYTKLEESTLNIPNREKITENLIALPYVLVGDEAFGISNNLLRPYPGKNLTVKRRIFNYRLSRARRYVECTFGILSNKWRIFHRPMNVSLSTSISVIKACCALHNFVRVRDGFQLEDTLTVTGLYDNPDLGELQENRGRRADYAYRDAFSEYFSSAEGEVPWQSSKI